MVYLIDFENVHEEGFQVIGRISEKDAVYCFFTKNVAKISMSALAGIKSGQLHFIEAESGKQSLDLALVSYLGYLIGIKPQELYYDIISNDNGFTKAADFWNKRIPGMRIRLRKTNAEIKQKTQSQTTPSSNTSDVPVALSAPPIQSLATSKAIQTASPTPAAEGNPESAITSALESAGMDPAAADFLQQQVEKYRSDKNVKQLVYRAVVKKYGQRVGTKIYNSTKKLLLK